MLYNLIMARRLESHLKEACSLSNAAWAALVERRGGQWTTRASYRLTKPAVQRLLQYLSQDSVDAWMATALKGTSSRSAPISETARLTGRRLYIYPLADGARAILVGADQQSAAALRTWRLIADLTASAKEWGNKSPPPLLSADFPYNDRARALNQVLARFVQAARPNGAWLGIRRGDALDILTQWNASALEGLSLSLEVNPILRRLNRTLVDIVVFKDQAEWEALPHPLKKAGVNYWMCLPLVVGQRLIGAVGLWGEADLSITEAGELSELAQSVSPLVEIALTFREMSGYLRRFAMLNEFALTISSAQNLDQIARRVFGLLTRAFNTDLIALYLPSSDGRLVREFGYRDGKLTSSVSTLLGHSVLPFLDGRILRVNDAAPDFHPLHAGARSALMVPLRHRDQIVGLLSLESVHPEAFSAYDEHLLLVIASHLASLAEYGRLREEAEGRARNLGLIHEVVQQVIGLSDKQEVAQVTADLLAQYFAYELAAVVLVGEDGRPSVFGLGGAGAALVRDLWRAEAGLPGHVLLSGESVWVNETDQDKRYQALPGWQAGSQMCVALKDGERVLGLINVESGRRNAFTHNDLMALESLAGVLAAVVSNADQYHRLQETIHQLRAAQVELRARMASQQEAERRLVQAAKLAAVGEMAAGVAHELNNPLTTVTGFAELLLEQIPQDAPYRADVEMILREARRARSVVRRLLDFARQGERTRARADLNEIVRDVLALTERLIQTSGVLLNLRLEEGLPWVSVDINQMKQVFLNLIHNALQAMPTGGEMEIQTASQSRDGREWVTIAVKDTGMGIAPEHKDRIFEPFFTTRGEKGGTGLGLSVTYGIVSDHGGTIEVESQPGAGSIFTVWLPV